MQHLPQPLADLHISRGHYIPAPLPRGLLAATKPENRSPGHVQGRTGRLILAHFYVIHLHTHK